MSTVPKRRYTPEEYLAIERAAEFKSEFFDGEMFAMDGGPENHSLIAANTIGILGTALRDTPCKVHASGMRLLVESSGLFAYPDTMVVCGQAQFLDSRRDTILNPRVIVEVRAPATEHYDLVIKFKTYRKLESLEHYVLVSHDEPHIECYTRRTDGNWLLSEVSGLDAVMPLKSIDCELPLAEVYAKVEFTPPEPPARAEG